MFDDDDDEGSTGGAAAWMATFADMMTLLLTFFILLLSFATMDIVKFRQALGSVKEAFGVQFVHDGSFEAIASSPLQLEMFEEAGLLQDQALLDELNEAIAQEGLENDIEAEINGRGVVVRIDGRVLYQQGFAEIRPEAEAILSRIAGLMRRTEHLIMVEGHTDDVPIGTSRFPSNWELSTARAIAAMRFLVDHEVDAERVGVAGYADQRPLEPNDSVESRAANRRVEFVFFRDLGQLDVESGDADESTEAELTEAADGDPSPPDMDAERTAAGL